MKTTRSRTGEILCSVTIAGLKIMRDLVVADACVGCNVTGSRRGYWQYSDARGYRGAFHSKDCFERFCIAVTQSPERLQRAKEHEAKWERERRKQAIEIRRAAAKERRSTPRTTVVSRRTMHLRRAKAKQR